MTNSQAIQSFAEQIVRGFHPSRIVLFGSHAVGCATDDSDVDLLVEMPLVGTGLGTAARIVRETKPAFAVDLIVRTPEQVQTRLHLGDRFMANILQTGKVLYETDHR